MKIVILGGGESGFGSAVLARKEGFDVFLSDSGKLKEEYKSRLVLEKIEFEEGATLSTGYWMPTRLSKVPVFPTKPRS